MPLRGSEGEIQIASQQRAVTAAGTPKKIREATEYLHNKVVSISIRAGAGNTGNIYIANEEITAAGAITTSGDILAPGERLTLDVSHLGPAPDGSVLCFNLNKIWIDADTSGNTISYTCIEVQ